MKSTLTEAPTTHHSHQCQQPQVSGNGHPALAVFRCFSCPRTSQDNILKCLGISHFHRRSLQELWFMWRPGSRASLTTRFFRFVSMDLLVGSFIYIPNVLMNFHQNHYISLGVSVAYFSSIAELAISATGNSAAANPTTGSMTFFDSMAFLTMFLLIG